MSQDLFDLTGKVALITGGSRGLGRQMALAFAERGADIAVVSRKLDKCEETAAEIEALGRKALPLACHVGKWGEIDGMVDAVYEHFGKVDILVNSAGIAGNVSPVEDLDVDAWSRVIDINLTGTFLTNKAVLPSMKAQGYGRIVNIASVAGKEGNPNASHYAASKAGVIGFTKAVGKEVATQDIAVNCITPAAANTEILAQMTEDFIAYMKSKIPKGRFVEVEEIANMVAWMASPECSFTTGAVFDISGGRATY